MLPTMARAAWVAVTAALWEADACAEARLTWEDAAAWKLKV